MSGSQSREGRTQGVEGQYWQHGGGVGNNVSSGDSFMKRTFGGKVKADGGVRFGMV